MKLDDIKHLPVDPELVVDGGADNPNAYKPFESAIIRKEENTFREQVWVAGVRKKFARTALMIGERLYDHGDKGWLIEDPRFINSLKISHYESQKRFD